MNDDYILRIAESMGKAAGKLIFNKDQEEAESINIEAMNEKDILCILLKKLFIEGKYDKAENILFEQMERTPSQDIVNIGKEFYNQLLLKSDEELTKGKFSKKEIFQGLDDLKRALK
ncbi:DUF6483 family protein [Clostridium pasteurianum]|uniref:Uncharacterized protein n=1 Tax=Clostridium pasteurianum BC1 TaxID=86416 RepID=R4K6Z8_CLOPA|nr:DUF6483 family protein [Clostridium pasteurianum]AGK96299.1 hypothetical protein Clopa_1313 [Clostridium pasteurianum BC1]